MIAKHWVRKRFNRYWISICSIHGKGRYNSTCSMCNAGQWTNEWKVQKSKHWYRRHEFDSASGLFRRKGRTTCSCDICVTARGVP